MRKLCRTLTVSIFAAVLTAGTLTCADADARSVSYDLNIPSEDLTAALQSFAIASHHKLLYKAELTAGKISRALKGHFTAQEAIEELLSGTGLSYQITGSSVVLIKDQRDGKTSELRDEGNTPSSPRAATQSSGGQPILLAQVDQGKSTSDVPIDKLDEQAKDKKTEGLSEIVVTGTLIHDVAPITPVTTITHDDMVNQGYSTLTDVIAQLPQNFSGGGSSPASNTANGIGANAANNYSFASGVNLRGLGGSATLVLLNGRRLAPTAYGGTVDISQIPVSLVDRVEILTDGASALYGSDAVAGVVNIITRSNFSGIEAGGRVTDVSKGKAPNYGGNILAGSSWSGGGVVTNFDYERDNPLFARNRSFADQLPDPYALTPLNETYSFYLQAHQDLTDRLMATADGLFGRRSFVSTNLQPTYPAPNDYDGKVKQYASSLEFDYHIASEWRATLIAQFSKEQDFSLTTQPAFSQLGESFFDYHTWSVEPRLDGKLLDIWGGALRVALGAQFREEAFSNTNLFASPESGPLQSLPPAQSSRNVRSGYGELLIPIVGEENAIPLIQRLRIDLSERYDHYNDFGGTSNPKIGVEWVPIAGLAAHASYAHSFQAPTLYQVSNAGNYLEVAPNPDPRSPTGSSLVLSQDATNPHLQPETAKSFNVGFTYQPSSFPGVKLDLSYFSINFDNRIGELSHEGFSPFNVLPIANVLGQLVNLNPSVGQVNQLLNEPGAQLFNFSGMPFTPGDIKAIANLGFANAASEVVHGLDLSANYVGPELGYGRLLADLSATYFTRYEQRIAPGAESVELMNTISNPLRFRAKTDIGWERAGWRANARLNYSNAYHYGGLADSSCSAPSSCPIGSWATVDLSLAYADMGRLGPSWLQGVRLGLTVMNVFDRAPPRVDELVGGLAFGYDPVNANPLQRAFGVTFSKRWGAGSTK